MSGFDSVCHGLTTISTGGFSTYDFTIYEFSSSYIKIITCIFMFMGSVNFSLMYAATQGDFKLILKNDAFKWYVGMIIFVACFYSINIMQSNLDKSFDNLVLNPIFESISILSTTGILEPEFHLWGQSTIIILTLSMVCGSCAGSTTGGIKIDRVIIIFKHIKNEFYRMMHPNAIKTVIINGKGTSVQMVQKVMAFLAIYILVIMLGSTIITLLGVPLRNSFMYTLTAITNTGLVPDPVGEFATFHHLSDAVKWIISFIMLAGRLDLYTVLLIFTPMFWKN